MKRNYLVFLFMVGLFLSCNTEKPKTQTRAIPRTATSSAKITFIELGSNGCIPCRKMQPVMRAIEEKYAGQVEVVFYDVWTKKQRHFAYDYGIRIIPTQIFLDANGQEILRHEGFFPQEEIERFLQNRGLKPKG